MTTVWDQRDWTEIAISQLDGGILKLTLDRPDRLNAFTPVMGDELCAAFELANLDDSIAAIVVTGAGRAFCAGMDLGRGGNVFGIDEDKKPRFPELRARLDDDDYTNGVLDLGGRLTRTIHRCAKPVAAAINGAAIGIGATMTLAMDFRLASPDARIGFVFNRIGVVPEACSSWFLPNLVGTQQALEWLYRAEPISASEALHGRLLRSVLPADVLVEEAVGLMRELTSGRSPVAQAITRQLVRRRDDDRILSAHLGESLAMHWTSSRDGKEGVAAFLEKRPPRFSSKVSTDLPGDIDDWFGQ